jgi:hypothetical protein
MNENYILCEGFHDRAFWAGLLEYLGCVDLRQPGRPPAPIFDPWGLPVRGSGEYAFHSRRGTFIRIVPCGGRNFIAQFARNRLAIRNQKPLVRLVLNVDADTNADGSRAVSPTMSREAMRTLVQEMDPDATHGGDHDLRLTDGTIVSLVQWSATQPPSPGLPNQQTLERVACAAIVAAHPTWAQPVERWLESRPDPVAAGPKEYAWSYLAGWFAEYGSYEGFCRAIWGKPALAAGLVDSLRQSPAWAVADAVANS